MRLLNSLFLLFISYFKGGVYYARKVGVNVGEDCRIYTRNFGSEPFLINIGNKVTVTSGVKILTHDGATWLITNKNGKRYQKYAEVNIGNHVFIGVNSIIMPGVTVGDRVVIAAGSVVTKSISSNSVVAGVPAKKIMDFSAYESKVKNSFVNDDDLCSSLNYKEKVMEAMRFNK
jgi:acetyltransferase-like isoleucine patch superfamily enzyme